MVTMMTDRELNEALLSDLPEMRHDYVDFVGSEDLDIEEAGPVYGNTIGPWLAGRPEVAAGPPSDDALKRAFNLLERLAQQPDGSIADTVLNGWVFHWMFWGEGQVPKLREYRKLMGPVTLRLARAYSPDERFDHALK